ncbi:MAG TPA: inorganic phosphate transporter [Terriglobales bacterium]|nr:inorganic phosphate transporter [Terriglobales bacterium]
MPTPYIVGAILVIAFLFDFINGFHDAANSIATVVSTRVLTPGVAVIWAAFFNFVAALLFGTKVATTVGKGMVKLSVVDEKVIIAGLIGAVIWDLLTWWAALPTSSSHALMGGYAGAAIVKAGWGSIIWAGWIKVLAFIVISPIVGLVIAWALMVCVSWIFRRAHPLRVDRFFRKGQLLSSALFSLGHGTNDAQKTMGIVTGALFAGGYISSFKVPLWVIAMASVAMGLGTMSGGWRIVRTMGGRITKLKPVGGFCAETAGAITLGMSTFMGIPVSTTHTITGAIVGVGSVQRLSAVRWGIAGRIVWAWILTIPAAGLVATGVWLLLGTFWH